VGGGISSCFGRVGSRSNKLLYVIDVMYYFRQGGGVGETFFIRPAYIPDLVIRRAVL
jgi:hypothetical protein